MQYTVCETLMWSLLCGASLKAAKQGGITLNKGKAKRIYREIIARTPDIGGLKENPLRICLAGGAVWLALYKSADGKMSEELFAQMVERSMDAPLVQASFKAKRKAAFTLAGQQKNIARAQKSNQHPGPCNWRMAVTLGRDADEFTKTFHQCGLCGLGRQEGLFPLVKHMCVLDYKSVELMGGTLFRTQTLAQGGSCCDFHICRKGSRWEQEEMAKGCALK